MQSEFACHIGLRGRLFCRVCKVEGKNRTRATKSGGVESNTSGDDENATSEASSTSANSDAQAPASVTAKVPRKVVETFDDMLQRVTRFIKPGSARTKEETMHKLQSMFLEAKSIGSASSIKRQRTENGVKDTYQDHFLNLLSSSHKKKRGHQAKQAALDDAWARLPPITTSPVWRIKGLDPHSDTPVEILHVILLGFLKYLWRDVIHNQLKNKDEKKELLITRLDSLDVSGLGIPKLAGRTLVQYAGSLTGRDFRVIAQVAPFVLYDLVSPECYSTWLSLSRLVPMIWQPVIHSPVAYVAQLEKEIHEFLLSTARWSCQWFNKPKFHILVHLPEHIRRFGPAMLFATEAFESFNAVIWTKSLHSNRHAPSKDIATAFAQGNRVRHITSGGLFLPPTLSTSTGGAEAHPSDHPPPFSLTPYFSSASNWKHLGAGVSQLLQSRSAVTRYLGLDDHEVSSARAGYFTSSGAPATSFTKTMTASAVPNTNLLSPDAKSNGRFTTARVVVLANGDQCHVGNFVIYNTGIGPSGASVARVEEILVHQGSNAALQQEPSLVLLQNFIVLAGSATAYQMPRLQQVDDLQVTPLERHATVVWSSILCTVNVQHNCHANRCTNTGSRHVYQERERTSQTIPVTAHINKEDLILNVAQMRDARIVLRFREPSQDLASSSEHVLRQSVEKERRVNKTTRSSLSQSVTPSGPGAAALHPRVSALQHSSTSHARSTTGRNRVL